MKSKMRILTTMLAVMLCMTAFSVSAYAGDDVTTATEPPVVTAMPEQAPSPEPEPLTPEGNLSLVDDIDGEAAEDKQFITVVSKGGNYFYIIIDRAADGENTVHFLNQVDEADLLALMEDGEAEEETVATCICTTKCAAGSVNTDCAVCNINMTQCSGEEPTPVETDPLDTEPEPEEESSGAGGAIIFVLLLAVLGGGAFYYFKVLKNKPAGKNRSDLDDYDFGDDDEDDGPEDYEDDADLDEYDETESAGGPDRDSEDSDG